MWMGMIMRRGIPGSLYYYFLLSTLTAM